MKPISKPHEYKAADLMPRLGAAFFKERGVLPDVLRAQLEANTLAPRHVQAMNVIALSGDLTVGELAARLQIGLPAASQISGELETTGWLVRRRGEKDRRQVRLSLAPHRKEDLEEYCQRRVQPLLNVLSGMAEEGRKTFLTALEQFAAEIEATTQRKY